jgi:8-oxo-dGTP pyrophosphatase MutT (NUDIX family)
MSYPDSVKPQQARLPQQAAAIPIRRRGDDLQVCLIRKRLAGSWGIPKGTVDSGETHESTALNEAWEEAGIRGRLIGDALGTYKYEKFGRPLTVMVFVMEVLEHHKDWIEAGIRERKWVSRDEADVLLVEHPVHGFLSRALGVFPVDA